jgi:hypothetical protein
MSSMDTQPMSLSDAKYHLALAKPSPDAELLDEMVRRFPEHAADLTEFAIALALDRLGATDDETFETSSTEIGSSISKAMSRFHNRLYAEKKAALSSAEGSVDNPFASMPRSELRTFARAINANLPFVMKLRDRQIREDTMSEGFKRRVTEALEVPHDVVIAHFSSLPQVRVDARFKAEGKPGPGTKQTFEEAVRGSGLTSEQQEYLLKL